MLGSVVVAEIRLSWHSCNLLRVLGVCRVLDWCRVVKLDGLGCSSCCWLLHLSCGFVYGAFSRLGRCCLVVVVGLVKGLLGQVDLDWVF